MVRSVKPYLTAALLLGILAGCSVFRREERPAWRSQAESVCLSQKLVQTSAYVQPAPSIDGPGICGMDHPFKTTALAQGSVALDSRATLACPMLPMLDQWVIEVVQPYAQARFGEPVVKINTMGSYGCRTIDHIKGASLSEHAFGNAIDVAGFKLASGREINVQKGWKGPDEQERAFLREVQAGACTYFTTVLAPGSDMFHYNHIHVDLARHRILRDGTMYRVCKPVPTDVSTPLPDTATPADVNAEGEDSNGQMGIISQSPVVPLQAPQASFTPRPRTGNVGLPPATIGAVSPQYRQPGALQPKSLQPMSQGTDEEDTSQFDLPAM